MRRIIKYQYIKDNISFIHNRIIELKDAKNHLKININMIEKYYQGKDGKKLLNNYLDKLALIDAYIVNVNRYLDYLKWLVGEYNDNQQYARNNLDLEYSSNKPFISNFGDIGE